MGFEDPRPFNFAEISVKTFKADGKTLIVSIVFLFLLALCILCFVYFLYSFIRRAMLSRVRTTCPAAGGLDKAAIDRLPVVSYGLSHGHGWSCKGGECSICLGCFQEGEKVKVLPLCHHAFHSECVDTWLENRPSCPLCRGSVVRVDSAIHPEEEEEDDVSIATAV